MDLWNIILITLVVIVVVGFIASAILRAMGEEGVSAPGGAGPDRATVLFDDEVAAYVGRLLRESPNGPIAVLSEVERVPFVRGFVARAQALEPLIQKALPGYFRGALELRKNGRVAKDALHSLQAETARAGLDFPHVAKLAGLKTEHIAFVEKDRSLFELALVSKI